MSEAELVAALEGATRRAVTALFAEHPEERFYYCALITTGEALAPNLCAWSVEALDRAVSALGDPKQRESLEWSYADSPYYLYGETHFEEVRRLFEQMGPLDFTDELAWHSEFSFRLRAMEVALSRLDREGLFGVGPRRLGIVINVEVAPPDASNTERARRLNPPGALAEWLKTVAE